MKCPKCGYLGFDTGDRCRNCGYDFSLAAPVASSEPHEAAPAPASEAPLPFSALDDDTPLVKPSAQPRPPLAVRRASPEVPRFRAELRTPTMDFGFVAEPAPQAAGQEPAAGTVRTPAALPSEPAAAGPRLLAAALDVALLAGLDVLVLYFTLRMCGLSASQIRLLPVGPLAGFFVVLNGGYLAAFTAGGQTIGKMAAGLRVIGDGEPLSAGRAIVRTLLWALSAVPAGLGFLSILASADRRGLHDRFARTRVVATR